ncbi:unnamed protein product [Notodromas monacha]|uniref:Solute carrier organic anion transporter family member n=1 Tax=Notodromas monacha TaxID=399045 RepID=A0A7R9BUI8_9CRUS|nr:unnamed protein product [Notodromas monacha]CAG0922011.1 unnamed protein product [Notodromas monacha]
MVSSASGIPQNGLDAADEDSSDDTGTLERQPPRRFKEAEFDLFDEVSLGDGGESTCCQQQPNGDPSTAGNAVTIISMNNGSGGRLGRREQSTASGAAAAEGGDDEDDAKDEACGCGGWRPEFAKRFRTPAWMLFCFCLASFIQGMVVNGLVNVIISTVERRFQLSSTESGLIASFYDIGYFFCAIPVTYFGGRSQASKPKWVSAGVLFMAAGFFVFCLPHFTTPVYVAVRSRSQASKPKWVSAGVLFMAAGFFVFCLPHFTTPVYVAVRSRDPGLLNATTGTGTSTSTNGPVAAHLCSELKGASDCLPTEESLAFYKWVFYLAQFLIGVGATPLYTLAVTYVDENVASKSSSVYLGVFYAMASVGPAVGYVVGGQTLQIFTDFDSLDAQKLGLTPENNLWVGAWWIGFLGSAIFGVLIFPPIVALPKTLPGGKELKLTRKRETHQSNVHLTKWLENTKASNSKKAQGSSVTKIHVRELTMALVRVVAGNPTFLFLTLAGAAEGFLLAGFATFLPKYFENQFRLTAGLAAMIVGVVAVPGAGGGTLLGGYLIKHYDMKLPAIMKMCCVSTFLAGLSTLIFVFSCDDVGIAGVTAAYEPSRLLFAGGNASADLGPRNSADDDDVDDESAFDRNLDLFHACNSACNCDVSQYDPMCGSDGLLYYSPCFAGCSESQRSADNFMEFSRCSCVASSAGNENATTSLLLGTGVGKNCSSGCTYLPVAILFLLLIMVLTFITSMPSLTATLRVVEEADRSIALGVQLALLRVLGTIPAPVLFGKLMDLACSLWETIPEGPGEGCDVQGDVGSAGVTISSSNSKGGAQLGSCRAYFNHSMSTAGNENATTSLLLGTGVGKNCSSGCTYLPVAILFLLLIMVLTFITSMPSLTATLRVVEEADRSIALGVQLALLRVLGTIPAPVLFGKLMDLACSLWETIPEGPGEGCDVQGDVGSAGVTISSSNSFPPRVEPSTSRIKLVSYSCTQGSST